MEIKCNLDTYPLGPGCLSTRMSNMYACQSLVPSAALCSKGNVDRYSRTLYQQIEKHTVVRIV
ncbi:hypothetical protein B0F90DRAFT_1752778 [Multifurca ochricompacta]|uniref:Uncharacterized protein n=1 Tax=Multifurca ochricompacta TaxID=376703 RepID=A0AAD4LYX7_9AGAM|nr:hypothetical protein B0F90DRAFT_1752778 [Multifurca ochricompacta]